MHRGYSTYADGSLYLLYKKHNTMNDDLNKDRLGKLIALAKLGEGGERDVAISMVQKLCKKHGLDFDDVMRDVKLEEFRINCKKNEYKLLLHIVVKYAFDGQMLDVYHNGTRTACIFKTTKEKYIETEHAWAILSRLYKKEHERIEEAVWHGFLTRHSLYGRATKKEDEPDLSPEEIRTRRMGHVLAESMETANIHRTLPPGKP